MRRLCPMGDAPPGQPQAQLVGDRLSQPWAVQGRTPGVPAPSRGSLHARGRAPMTITAQDVADQLVARIKVKRDTLESLPKTPDFFESRAGIGGQIEGLTQALAMVRRIG